MTVKKYCGLLFLYLLATTHLTAQVTFVIESLPESTPASDSIFISGTFNGWNTSDPKYLLKKQPNGQLAVSLNLDREITEFKFTRGNWLNVETGRKNEYIPNRVISKVAAPSKVFIQILNWQDLGGARSFNYIIFYYFAMAFMGLVMIALSRRVKKGDAHRKRIFCRTNAVLVLLFIGAVSYYVVNPIWQNYLIMAGQILIFAWGPLIYFYARAFVSNKNSDPSLFHWLPMGIAAIISLLRFFNLDVLTFIADAHDGLMTMSRSIMIGVGTALCSGYLLFFLVRNGKRLIQTREENESTFLMLFLVIQLASVVFVFQSMLIPPVLDNPTFFSDISWLLVLASLVVILESYFLWRDPLLLKEKTQSYHINAADELLIRLKVLMEQEEVYKSPDLNIQLLADQMDTKSHILSKLLNEHFEQNFRDFVNAYRIKAFISQANKGKLENLTFLGLAHEVGFNSKSTFNLAFKKFTDQSPREYFRTITV